MPGALVPHRDLREAAVHEREAGNVPRYLCKLFDQRQDLEVHGGDSERAHSASD